MYLNNCLPNINDVAVGINNNTAVETLQCILTIILNFESTKNGVVS